MTVYRRLRILERYWLIPTPYFASGGVKSVSNEGSVGPVNRGPAYAEAMARQAEVSGGEPQLRISKRFGLSCLKGSP